MQDINQLKQMYERGENLIQHLTQVENIDKTNAIRISYDIQAGSYMSIYNSDGSAKRDYCLQLASLIDELETCDSIMIAGVGEAITLCCTIPHLKRRPKHIFGFDISWSRIKFANEFCRQQGLEGAELFVANMMQIPLADNSIDLVITNHSLEPNGGNETTGITELSRVANKYLLMNEPSYEFGDEKAKARIDQHGYVKHLAKHATNLGLNVIRNEPFGLSLNPLNPTGNTIVQIHDDDRDAATPTFQCPISGLPITKQEDALWGTGGYAFPIVGGIPCMLPENAVLASHFPGNEN